MTTRRQFIRSSALSAASIPFISSIPAASQEQAQLSKSLSTKEYWQQVRKMFPMPLDEAYFNTGTLGAQPTVVLERVIESMRDNAMHIARTDYQGNGPQLLSGYASYDDLRTKVAALVNASDYKEISLTQNATFGMNYVSAGLDLKPGDEIINTDQEHGGGRAGWQVKAARFDLVYKQAKIPIPANDPEEIVASIMKEVTPKTRVIAIPHIISVYGVVMPVKRICAEARKRGIFTILDGAQTVGQIQVDVQDIGCDAYYGSLHKWLLAPAGSGILYIRKDSVKSIWSTIASYQWENKEDDGFRLMQNGTGNPSMLDGMDAAIDFHNKIGSKKVTDRIKYLGDYLRAGLKEIDEVFIHSSVHPEMCAGITTYGINGVKGVDLQNEMWKRRKLQPRSVGEDKIRHSVHIYNSEEEIDAALNIVKDMAAGH